MAGPKIQRRAFLQRALMLSGATIAPSLWGCTPETKAPDKTKPTKTSWTMPDEGDAHACTWMSFCAKEEIWGEKATDVQRNLATIANAIAAFEPVKMLVRDEDRKLAASLVDAKVTLITTALDDLWIRDTGPVFVKNGAGELAGIDFNFNGWGNKQTSINDAKVASFVLRQSGFQRHTTSLVLEGGGIEVDGHGMAMITESCVLNDNRNPGVSKQACEKELKALLGLRKIIWLPGIKDKDITDGHTDFYARFARPGVVVAARESDPFSYDYAVTQQHTDILRAATDLKGNKLEIHFLDTPTKLRAQPADIADFAAGYINYYLCNGGLVMPEFGDKEADQKAQQLLQKLYPKRKLVPLNIDAIAAGGGGIHCTTQQQPKHP